MQKMPRKYYPRLKDMPGFVKAVKKAKGRDDLVLATLEAFEDDPFLLYTCLWYAWSQGVAVTFAPPTPETSPADNTPAGELQER